MNLVQNLRHRAELQPGVPAIVDRTVRGDRVASFVAFNRSVDFLALRLREEGVETGHQVLLALDPSQEFYLFALALLQIGAIPVICRKALGSSFLTEWVKNARPQACVLSQSRWLTQHFHQQLRLIPMRLFVHAFRKIWSANRIESRSDRLDRTAKGIARYVSGLGLESRDTGSNHPAFGLDLTDESWRNRSLRKPVASVGKSGCWAHQRNSGEKRAAHSNWPTPTGGQI
jgi:hypothetical protein